MGLKCSQGYFTQTLGKTCWPVEQLLREEEQEVAILGEPMVVSPTKCPHSLQPGMAGATLKTHIASDREEGKRKRHCLHLAPIVPVRGTTAPGPQRLFVSQGSGDKW